MFYTAYDLFNEGKYQDALDMFIKLSSDAESTKNVRYWSNIFSARCFRLLGIEGELGLLFAARDIFPDRAEAICEIGISYHRLGNDAEAEAYLTDACKCTKTHTCIRYEQDKYFELPHEILIDICMKQSRHNDAEELITSLMQNGNVSLYNQDNIKYNRLHARFYNNAGLEFLKAKSIERGDDLVIELPKGYDGLGDNLVFSHIPRVAKESGAFKKVYISTMMNYKGPGYREMVWDTNPYIDGFVERPGTYSRIQMARVMNKWENIIPSINIMDALMYLHNLDDGAKDHRPECYYTPNESAATIGKVVLDIGAKSLNIKGLDIEKLLEFLGSHGIRPDAIISPEVVDCVGIDILKPDSLEEWADMMHSSKRYVCFNSGGYWLSGALGIKATHIWIKGTTIPAWSFLEHENLFVDRPTIFQEGK